MQDITYERVQDSRVNFDKQFKFGVYEGGDQINVSYFTATTTSSSNLSFNIIVPSLDHLVSREVSLETEVTFTWTTNNNATYEYGYNMAPQSFPLHRMMNTLQTTINSNTSSTYVQSILPALLRCLEKETMKEYYDVSAVENDKWSQYYYSSANQNGSLNLLESALEKRANQVEFVSYSNGGGQAHELKLKIREPLLISPFEYCSKVERSMYGIQNININIQNSNYEKALSLFVEGATASSFNVTFNSAKVRCMFITPHPSLLLNPVCKVPYYVLNKYENQTNSTLALGAASVQIQSQNITLTSVPDKLIIYVADKTLTEGSQADYLAVIENVNITFNNVSGLFSSYEKKDLYLMSKRNGSQQSWDDFNGVGSVRNLKGASAQPLTITSIFNQQNNTVTSTGTTDNKVLFDVQRLSTTGSIVVIDFAKDLALPEFLAPGSIGNFNIFIETKVSNRTNALVDGQTGRDLLALKQYAVFMNSGVYTIDRGVSSSYSAVLDKQIVLNTIQKEPVEDMQRVLGGKMNILSGIKAGMKLGLPVLRRALENIPVQEMIVEKLKEKGYGKSGGAMSGGKRLRDRVM